MFCKQFLRKLAGVIILSIVAFSTSVRYQDVPCKDIRVWKQERFFSLHFLGFYVLSVIVSSKFPSSSTAA